MGTLSNNCQSNLKQKNFEYLIAFSKICERHIKWPFNVNPSCGLQCQVFNLIFDKTVSINK